MYRLEKAAANREYTKGRYAELLALDKANMNAYLLGRYDGELKRALKAITDADNEFAEIKKITLDYIDKLEKDGD